MAELIPSREYISEIAKLFRRHSDLVLVYNKKTGKAFTRSKSHAPSRPPTEEQKKLRQGFGNLSHEAATWLRANNATACPPFGTKDYRQLVELFDKQHDSPTLLHFAMARLKKNGKVI